MDDSVAGVLMNVIEENRQQVRQAEDQRASVTNLIIVIAAAVSGIVSQLGSSPKILPLTIPLIFLGLYGVIATAKLFERAQFHGNRANHYLEQLDKICPKAALLSIQTSADAEHTRRYRLFAVHVKMHILWEGLHLLIALLGVIYTILAVV